MHSKLWIGRLSSHISSLCIISSTSSSPWLFRLLYTFQSPCVITVHSLILTPKNSTLDILAAGQATVGHRGRTVASASSLSTLTFEVASVKPRRQIYSHDDKSKPKTQPENISLLCKMAGHSAIRRGVIRDAYLTITFAFVASEILHFGTMDKNLTEL